MTSDKAPNYPYGLFVLAIVLTVALAAGINALQFNSHKDYNAVFVRVNQLQELKANVVYLDEVMTLYANLAIFTGEIKWPNDYVNAQKKLDEALYKIIELNIDTKLSEHASTILTANYYLVDMEQEALRLTKSNQKKQALKLLKSLPYLEQKEAYASGVSHLSQSISQLMIQFDRQLRQKNTYSAILSLFVVLVILGIWLFVFHRLSQWRDILSSINEELDLRVTARTRQLDQERQRTVYAAKMAALGEMAGGIAHEINNPLEIINLKSQILDSNLKASPEYSRLATEHLDVIRKTSRRIGKIVEGLKKFARDGSSDPVLHAEAKPIVESALELCSMRLSERKIKLQVDSIPEDIKIKCRPTEVTQVLVNLINNAFDATELLKDGKIIIKFNVTPGLFYITVSDNGSGVPESLVEKIGQPFFTTKEVGKGIGLGLSISKRIIDGHGGTFSYDRQNGLTSFSVSIPR